MHANLQCQKLQIIWRQAVSAYRKESRQRRHRVILGHAHSVPTHYTPQASLFPSHSPSPPPFSSALSLVGHVSFFFYFLLLEFAKTPKLFVSSDARMGLCTRHVASECWFVGVCKLPGWQCCPSALGGAQSPSLASHFVLGNSVLSRLAEPAWGLCPLSGALCAAMSC